MVTFASTRSAYCPPQPDTLADLDVPHGLLVDLVLRRTFTAGQTTLQDLSQALKLSPLVIEAIFRELRQQQLIEVKGMVGNDYSFVLTQAGRSLASERYQICHYAGPCPVSIKQYHKATKMQAAKVRVDRRSLRQALSDLVLPDRLLDQLGPAIISQSSIFLYGPTGSGKTSLAERLLRVYQDAILVPYAVEVDGQIIQLYDPVVHEAIETTDQEFDPRWVLCRRPCVITGGELAPSMLELRLDESSGIYAAPLQMKANNGVLVIDDFGRQLMSPRELLNRWIVPLDRRVDYLALRYGVKFQIPFEMLVVFATNLDPRELADEAFLRRLHNKVYVEAVEPQLFDEIFRRVATARNIPFEPDSADYLRKLCFREGGMELRACYPADICDILVAIANYEGRPVRMTKADLERAVALYFAQT
ncbi:MAG TPA: AAA family ATPase [Bryobacteraceae bacterium]|nr:AAA family ATPase [Bryobacteraceae bacterium]HPU71701.1 AAA family ATPase [Bryobacteraceae bacterium]